MYELMLTERVATVLAAISISVCTSVMLGSGRLWLSGLAFNYAPAMAAAFYVVAFLAEPRPNSVDLIAGILFEAIVLLLFFWQLLKIKKDLILVRECDVTRVLKILLILQLLVSLQNITTAGFGLFSEESRIAYLEHSSLAKYYAYAGVLISAVQAVLLASLVTARRYLGVLGWIVICANFVLSVMSGSKGGVFLWMLSIAALVDYRRAGIKTHKIIVAMLIGTGLLIVSSFAIADSIGLELGEFIDLVVNRFFLNNDARALSLDLRSSASSNFNFLSEAFRSLSNLIGFSPRNEPLGVLLYRERFNTANGDGANASFMALAAYYFPIGYALLPAMLGMLGAVLFAWVARTTTNRFNKPVPRLSVAAIWLATFVIYSQDFLAFQVLMPLAVLAVVAIWISQRRYYCFMAKSQYGKC